MTASSTVGANRLGYSQVRPEKEGYATEDLVFIYNLSRNSGYLTKLQKAWESQYEIATRINNT